uniref:Ribosomal protein L7Ae/L30e/S12e/Gadd45 domain-containing protein n=1 Tax=Oreochromis aureus TaxID=47969 RepID=A0AAZ1WV34_OREAU
MCKYCISCHFQLHLPFKKKKRKKKVEHTQSRICTNHLSCLSYSDPDSVAFCILATDEEYECDIALQIHFTLIQAFCFDNDINVVRVNDIDRLADLVGADETGEPKDAHCILVTSPSANPWKDPALDKLSVFCEERRSVYDWVPTITLPER